MRGTSGRKGDEWEKRGQVDERERITNGRGMREKGGDRTSETEGDG